MTIRFMEGEPTLPNGVAVRNGQNELIGALERAGDSLPGQWLSYILDSGEMSLSLIDYTSESIMDAHEKVRKWDHLYRRMEMGRYFPRP